MIDASPFLDDQLNLKKILRRGAGAAQPYVLNPQRTYFGPTKAFPKNVLLEVRQDWVSDDQRLRDVPADPRQVQIRVVYNLAEPPRNDGYRPRLADDRVGVYDDVYLQFDDERVLSRSLRYVVRWNLQPSDPSKPVSPATHPMLFYLSNTIPEKYRPTIRDAVLKWNDAFLKIGVSDAIQVREQPDDPNWDPDDIRYNVLRWIAEYRGSFGADSQTLFDPRTGEEFRTGILISADVPLNAQRAWTYLVDPVRYGRSTDPMPQAFLDETWYSTILHETGHNLGFQHNFIGSRTSRGRTVTPPIRASSKAISPTILWAGARCASRCIGIRCGTSTNAFQWPAMRSGPRPTRLRTSGANTAPARSCRRTSSAASTCRARTAAIRMPNLRSSRCRAPTRNERSICWNATYSQPTLSRCRHRSSRGSPIASGPATATIFRRMETFRSFSTTRPNVTTRP